MKRSVPSIAWIVCLLMVAACSTAPNEEANIEYFKVKVDSVQVPAVLTLGDTLAIRCYGTVGTSGCYSFDRFEPDVTQGEVRLTVWGLVRREEICTTNMVYLEGAAFRLVPASRGPIRIVIQQPNGSFLSDSLIVR